MRYEYKVVPAPAKPQKAPRIKGAEAKFAHGLETVMNTYAADGWEYQRADILPSEERRGLRSSQTVYRTVLVFRRALDEAAEAAPLFGVPHDVSPPEPPAAPEVSQGYEATDVSEVSEVSEASEAEQISDAERRSHFSLVGPARRNQEAAAPPLAAPHVTGETRSQTDPSDDGR